MTTLKEVTSILANMNDELAKQWLHNDIIKMKLAIGYDSWINDINDHNLFLSLKEFIETCIDSPEYIR